MATHAENAALREAVFRPSETLAGAGTARAPTTTSALLSKIPVITLPAAVANDKESVRAFHLYLMVSGTSASETRSRWQAYVATLSSLCFSSMKTGILQGAAFEERPMTQEKHASLMSWYDAYYGSLDPAVNDADRAAAHALHLASFPDLDMPMATGPEGVNLDDALDPTAIYGHFSLVLFLAGKSITDANRAAITIKRPSAIERKYFAGRSVAPLTGPLSLSTMAHTQIHTAFVQLTHLRREVFTQVAQFNTQTSDPMVEIVATTTRLMRYSGMQQAVLIDNYLSSHEEAFRVPLLIPAIQAYTASMKDLRSVPAEHRPYFKLINGDTTRAFNRNDIENLLTVALMEARETNPTLQQYAMPVNAQLVMDKYTKALQILADEEE